MAEQNPYYQQPMQGQNSGLAFHPEQAQQQQVHPQAQQQYQQIPTTQPAAQPAPEQKMEIPEQKKRGVNLKVLLVLGLALVVIIALLFVLFKGEGDVVQPVVIEEEVIEETKEEEVVEEALTALEEKYIEALENKQAFKLVDLEFCEADDEGNYNTRSGNKFKGLDVIRVCGYAEGFTDVFNDFGDLSVILTEKVNVLDANGVILKEDEIEVETFSEDPNFKVPIYYAIRAGVNQQKGEYSVVFDMRDQLNDEEVSEQIKFEIV